MAAPKRLRLNIVDCLLNLESSCLGAAENFEDEGFLQLRGLACRKLSIEIRCTTNQLLRQPQ